MSPDSTFKDLFIKIADLSAARNVNVSAFAEATDLSVSNDDMRLNTLLRAKDNIILVARSSEVMILHSITNLGGSLNRPEQKVVGLQGLGSQATPVSIDANSLVKALSISVPRDDKLFNCSDIASLQKLRTDRSSRKMSFTPMYIPAPLEAKIILETSSKDPLQILLALKNAPTLLQGNVTLPAPHEDDDPIQIIAEGGTVAEGESGVIGDVAIAGGTRPPPTATRLHQWLWAAGNGKIPFTDVAPDSDDTEIKEFATRRHAECILPPIQAGGTTAPIPNSDDTLRLLTHTISRMSETHDETNALRAIEMKRLQEKDDDKKDRTKDWLQPPIHKMLLFASSADGYHAASELNPDFLTFFNAKSVGAAGKHLHWYLMANGLRNSVIAVGAINAIYFGNFFSFNPNVVKDLCVFSFQEGSGLSRSQTERFMVLHMADVMGKSKSQDEITSRFKQNVVVPKDYHEMMSCAKRYNCIQGMLLTKQSLLYKYYKSFVKQLKRNKSVIQDMCEEDPDVCTKILFQAETGIKLWAESCIYAGERNEVNDSHIDFDDIIKRIQHRDVMSCVLPACFKTVVNEKKRENPNSKHSKDNKNPRTESSSIITNDNVFDDFKLHENEDYQIFTGREKAKSRPKFRSTRMCPKWNIKGSCYADCMMKESHVPHESYSQKQKDAFSKWMSECRKA